MLAMTKKYFEHSYYSALTYSTKTTLEFLKDNKDTIIVYEDEGELIGFIQWSYMSPLTEELIANIDFIFVEEDSRRKGIAHEMVLAMHEQAKKDGAVVVSTSPLTQREVAFAIKEGYSMNDENNMGMRML